MPLYEYKCSNCEHSFELILKAEDNNGPVNDLCPHCGESETIHKVLNINLHHGVTNPRKKMDSNFKSEMERIKSEHPKGFRNSAYF